MIWLASYPRSGNTWMRFLLCSYLVGRVRDVQTVEARIPNLHRGALDRLPRRGPIVCKTHLPFGPQHPAREDSRGVIYLLRHPKDVLLSNLNYFAISCRDLDARQFALDFIREGGVPDWRRMGIGGWAEHVRSWIGANTLPKLVIRYEAMVSDPGRALGDALAFLGIEPDRRRLGRAVRSCTLSRLRQLELADRATERPILFPDVGQGLDAGRFFFHRGATGQSLESIGDDLDDLFDRRFSRDLPLLCSAPIPAAATEP
jgi:hypothetical protein